MSLMLTTLFAVLPIADLMRTWSARNIGPSPVGYTFRSGFRAQRSVSEEEMLAETLKTVRDVVAAAPTGPVMYGGAAAFTRAAEVLCNQPPDAFTGLLVYFGLPLGARRCVDAAGFFRRVGRSEATRLMGGKAEVFGRAQYHGPAPPSASTICRVLKPRSRRPYERYEP